MIDAFAFEDIDPSTDFVKRTAFNETADDVLIEDFLSPVGGMKPGEIWYFEASATFSDELQNEGFLAVSENVFTPDGTESYLMARVKDGSEGRNVLRGYVSHDELTNGEVQVSIHSPDAAYDAYSWVFLEAFAVKMRRGFDLSPNAFSPNQVVSTYDGTVSASASFAAATPNASETDTHDLNGNGADDAVTYVADIPEYTDSDNPIMGAEVRYQDGISEGTSTWSTEWTELQGTVTLPQSSQYSDFPLLAGISENDELPEPTDGYVTYEWRPVLYDASEKELTYTTGSVEQITLFD